MPRISELNDTDFPTLDHEFATEYAGESVKLTIAQVRALMEFLATEIGYNAGTVAEALDDLASGKVNVSEYTAAIASKMNNLLYTPGGAPLDSGFNDITAPGPAPRLARSATGGPYEDEAPTLNDYYYVLVFEFGGNLIQVAFSYLGGSGRNCYFRARMAGVWSTWNGLINSAGLITSGVFDVARIPATLTPDKAFRRGNLLGPVSQSAGVPTGAIVERGSSVVGEYVRFADGTQICTFYGNVTAAINTAYGSIFIGSTAWTFPAAFVAVPVAGILRSNTAGGAAWGCASNVQTTTQGNFYLHDAVSRASATVAVGFIAIGRWF